MKLLEENVRIKPLDLAVGNDFWYMMLNAQATQLKMNSGTTSN